MSERSSNATDRAYRQLKADIVEGRMPPHANFLESDLAARLEMSRTPVREACIKLQAEGFVEIVPRRGIQVVPISAKDMAEVYDLLGTLEGRAAELAAARDIPEAELAQLDDAITRMDQALRDGDLVAWAHADSDFHRGLVIASGNRHLAETVLGYADLVQRARMLTLRLRGSLDDSVDDHLELLTVIKRGDAQRARDMHLEHRRTKAALLTELLETSGLTTL